MTITATMSTLAENAFQVVFNVPIYFSALLDQLDASPPTNWTFVGSGVGLDGQPARPVSTATTAIDASGMVVTLTTDRPTSPFPCTYQLSVGLVKSTLAFDFLSGPVASSAAAYRELVPPQQQVPAPARDFANPQTLSGAVGSTISRASTTKLGSLGYSDDGDYAIDQGDVALRKRLARRTFARKGGFAYLPGYGVGLRQKIKMIGSAAVRDQIAAECESQYSQEPEVARAAVSLRPDAARAGLFRLATVITKKSGQSVVFETLVRP